MLKIENLHIRYDFEVLNIEYLCLNRGLFYIKGSSGSGKTSLFKCIDNKINYDGEIVVKGSLGVYYQNNILNDNFSIYDMRLIDNRINLKIYYYLLLRLDLISKEKIKTRYLSKGEKQRLELVVLLSLDRDIYLLDEPCSNLNEKYKTVIYKYLEKLKNEKLIIANVHDENVFGYEIKNKKLIIDVDSGKEITLKEEKKVKYNLLLVSKIMFNKISSVFNILNVCFSIFTIYLSFNLKDLLNEKLNVFNVDILNNIIIKMFPVFDNIKLVSIFVFIISLLAYIFSFINECVVEKENISNLIFYFNKKIIINNYIIRLFIEIFLILIISFIFILIFNLYFKKIIFF